MKKINFISLACVAALLGACNSDDGSSWSDTGEVPVSESFELNALESRTNKAVNSFAFDIFREASKDKGLTDEKGNIAVSPLSATVALSMAANSFDENVENAVSRMLGLDDISALNSTCRKLMQYLPSRKTGTELSLANSAWYNSLYTVNPVWSGILVNELYSSVAGLDFSDASSVATINSWCSDKTRGMIDCIINKLQPEDYVVLLNAMYFCGEWSNKFDEAKTKRMDFHGIAGTSAVDMMYNEDIYRYYRGINFEIVRLRFDGTSEMSFVLPEKSTDIDAFATTFNADKWNDFLDNNFDITIKLSLPKFSVNNGGDMTEVLKKLGLPETATVEKMGIKGSTRLKVAQKSATKIDEKGATLAAVTEINGTLSSPSTPITREIELAFDRPFLYFVNNSHTGTIIMAGIVRNL